MTARLSLRNVRKVFGSPGDSEVLAIDDVSIDVAQGEFLAIIGPSGCGKSTLLKIAAGLTDASSGQVEEGGRPVTACEQRSGSRSS